MVRKEEDRLRCYRFEICPTFSTLTLLALPGDRRMAFLLFLRTCAPYKKHFVRNYSRNCMAQRAWTWVDHWYLQMNSVKRSLYFVFSFQKSFQTSLSVSRGLRFAHVRTERDVRPRVHKNEAHDDGIHPPTPQSMSLSVQEAFLIAAVIQASLWGMLLNIH